jgi:hypothetical protein
MHYQACMNPAASDLKKRKPVAASKTGVAGFIRLTG